jgi:hypothetical protein
MGPRPDQPRALIGERRQLDLQAAFMGPGASAKDFEDEAGAVDDLGLPLPLEIALLHRRQGAVDDNEADFLLGDHLAKRFDPALADQRRRDRPAEANDLAGNDIEVDRLGEADRLVEPGVERASGAVARLVAGRGLQGGMDDKGAAGGRGGIMLDSRQG